MALTQVSGGGIKDGQIHTADLADGAISAAKLHSQARDETYTLGADGSNHYTFTGKGLTGAVNDPTLYLERGKTYRFVNGNSSGAHPFRIQTTVNGSAGTEYNTGVTNNGGAGGSTIVFEVPHAAPDTLYYQCTSHGSMGGIFYITGALADSRVTTAKLANDGVTTAKIADSNITTAKIADDAVTTAKIADDSIVASQIQAAAVNESKLHISNSPTDGYFLSAQSGNAGGLTWAQVAQPDLTNLSASNLTSGTVPDARFPATLPAASGANLTNLAASALSGVLPAISGANLTNLPASGAVSRVFIGTAGADGSSVTVTHAEAPVPWRDMVTVSVTNCPANARYLVYVQYDGKANTNNNSNYQQYIRDSGGEQRVKTSYNTNQNANSWTEFGPYISLDTASSTNDRTYKIQSKSGPNRYAGNVYLRYCALVVIELIV